MQLMKYLILTSAAIGQACSLQLELHFDVNGTIIASDMAQGRGNESTILQEIAKETLAKWVDNGEEKNYQDHVKQDILPGNEVQDQSLKRRRRQQYVNILANLKKTNHPLYCSLKDRFDLVMERINAQDTPVFQSFWSLLEWLECLESQKKLTYKIVFRTFGHDIPAIKESLVKKGFSCDHLTIFKSGHLVYGDETHDAKHHHAISGAMAAHKFNAVQDDWRHWNIHEEKREFGKPFYFDKDHLHEDARQKSGLIRIFFDDNVLEKEIIYPLSIEGTPLDVQKLIDKGYLVNVKTLDAIIDDYYFINHVKPFLGDNL